MVENIIDIVACTDKWFVMPTGVMMYSVCVNNPNVNVVFHIITDEDVTDTNRFDLKNVTVPFYGKTVLFYPIPDSIKKRKFPSLDNRIDITRSSYYRLFLSEILPNTMDKVLYLDGDLIVRHSLLPILNTDLEGKAIGAVCCSMEGDIELFNRLRYPPQKGYFNAGVLLINLKYWRDYHVVNDFMSYMQNHSEEILYHDQDVLNVVFQDNKICLPVKYNLQNGFFRKTPLFDYWKYEKEIKEGFEDPVIVHFDGEKPWYASLRHPHPFKNTFYVYQKQTKWKGLKFNRIPFKRRLYYFMVDVLRKWNIIPQNKMFVFIDIAPID